jgi:hypothetical protein
MEGREMIARTRLVPIVGLVVGVAAWGCSDSTAPVCTDIAIPGLAIDVKEAESGLLLRRDVTIIVATNGFQESVTLTAGSPTAPWSGAYERPGTYTITVRRPGYRDWVRAGVIVEREDRCHVRTTFVTAELEPANEARFTFTGAAVSGTFESRGVPRLPVDYTRDFAALAVGRVNTTDVPHQLLAVNAGSSYFDGGFDDFVFWLNPRITQPGTYGASSCPEPADFGGCAHAIMNLGVQTGGGPTMSLFRVPSTVSVTVLEIGPDRLRATFEGTFTLSRPGESLGQAAVSGSIDGTRTFAP